MVQTFRNAWKIPELRRKILFTLFIVLLYRLGNAVPVPYVDTNILATYFAQLKNTVLGLYNTMSGGAFSLATIFALSIQPYINASIIIELLTIAIPALERLAKEDGEEGRKKIQNITRYTTIGLGLLMGFAYYVMLKNYSLLSQTGFVYGLVIVLTFTAGASFLMWMGEQINEFGIGNGISMILFAGIVSRASSMVNTVITELYLAINGIMKYWFIVPFTLVLFLAAIVFIVIMTNAERRIPVQYAQRVVGRKMYGGQSTHIPIKVNMSGVLPVIFASSILSIPSTIAGFMNVDPDGIMGKILSVIRYDHWVYAVLYFFLIMAFNYFYISIQYNPMEIANNLRKNNGTIPGIRPGKPTAEFIARVVSKVTVVGGIFLAIIAIGPILLSQLMGINISLGGTSIIIVVGVALDTVRQLESQMMMRHYKGFLE